MKCLSSRVVCAGICTKLGISENLGGVLAWACLYVHQLRRSLYVHNALWQLENSRFAYARILIFFVVVASP